MAPNNTSHRKLGFWNPPPPVTSRHFSAETSPPRFEGDVIYERPLIQPEQPLDYTFSKFSFEPLSILKYKTSDFNFLNLDAYKLKYLLKFQLIFP